MKAVIQSANKSSPAFWPPKTSISWLETPKKWLKGVPFSVDAMKLPRLGLSGSQTTVIEATIVLRMNDYVPGGQKRRFQGNNILIISPKVGNPSNRYWSSHGWKLGPDVFSGAMLVSGGGIQYEQWKKKHSEIPWSPGWLLMRSLELSIQTG